jgi:formamidopyrimidine-DNA glycosylase
MPELPDVVLYIEALERRILDQPLSGVRLASPFLLRTAQPPIGALTGKPVRRLRRLGKRIALGFADELWLVLHLMINGRLHWKEPNAKLAGRYALAAFDFPEGTLTLTEFGPKKRASLHLGQGEAALREHDPGGLEVFEIDLETFRRALASENHTLKRALTDPHLLSGIGNAYSDEILHVAKLSPYAIAGRLDEAAQARLLDALHGVLDDAVRRSVGQEAARLKGEKRAGLRVHARTGLPCPACGDTVREVSFADRSFQYCPTCQTGGKPLADRRLSRLLR